ncbi:MAG: type II toxin-antitoxin system YafQ family toxin [Patescibacteria group bacterium]|nr:type II toxin-antitoxin system YafQ family toxin [Patescibacteria group bacterium]
MFVLKLSSRFKKDLKPYKYDKQLLEELETVLNILVKGKDLPIKYCNHPLIGEFKGCFECHIKPDVLLIYKLEKAEITISLLRIGSHSDLF